MKKINLEDQTEARGYRKIEISTALRGADASAGGPAAREEKIGGTPL
jgi:hypothetical protein